MPRKNDYVCDICLFSSTVKRKYEQHLRTFTHRVAVGEIHSEECDIQICTDCGEPFGSRTSLWRHKRYCTHLLHSERKKHEATKEVHNLCTSQTSCDKDTLDHNKSVESLIDMTVLSEVLKETKTLREAFVQQSKTIETLREVNERQNRIIEESLPKYVTTNNITNVMHNHNQNFNINVFLNERCKDALNLSDFVQSIVVQIDDLERTKSIGYVKGVTDIIVKNLRQLDVYSRPIHCSDPLQEILYVKNDNMWRQDREDKPMVRGAISAVAKKQLERVKDWEQQNTANVKQGSEQATNEYIQLVKHVTSAETDEENRILKNIAREVVINKSSQ